MKILIDGIEEVYQGKIRFITTIMKREKKEEFPELIKWKIQILYSNNKWIEICRIDNYLHEGKIGSHVHQYGSSRVNWIELTVNEADRLAREISARILKEKFNEEVKWI